jgi:hypothetical protein
MKRKGNRKAKGTPIIIHNFVKKQENNTTRNYINVSYSASAFKPHK